MLEEPNGTVAVNRETWRTRVLRYHLDKRGVATAYLRYLSKKSLAEFNNLQAEQEEGDEEFGIDVPGD